jgi:hypothetical protein
MLFTAPLPPPPAITKYSISGGKFTCVVKVVAVEYAE